MIRTTTISAILTAATIASADAPTPAATATAAAASEPGRNGFAVGAELGSPTSVTAGWFHHAISVAAALGTGTFSGPGLSFHADAQMVVKWLRPDVPLRVGFGGRYYHHGYQPMSIDEIPDSHYGVRASVAVAIERKSLEMYAELAPGIDVKRTASCTLADGPNSICPHAQERPYFVQLVVGARWFFSH